jgi:hypothetical protein
MRESEKKRIGQGGVPTKQQAKQFETAFAMGVQLRKPLRLHDLSTLRFGVSVPPSRGQRRGRFEFSAHKNGKQISLKLEGEMFEFYELLLRHYRPVLLEDRPDQGFVFVGGKRCAIAKKTLAKRISNLVWDQCRLDWNVHLFRHYDAWVLEQAGGDISDVARLLGIEISTAFRHYRKDTQEESQDRMEAALGHLQDGKWVTG